MSQSSQTAEQNARGRNNSCSRCQDRFNHAAYPKTTYACAKNKRPRPVIDFDSQVILYYSYYFVVAWLKSTISGLGVSVLVLEHSSRCCCRSEHPCASTT